MKARFLCALMAACLLLNGGWARADARYVFAEKALIRLQVRAASDSQADQSVKLIVRDAVRACAVESVREAQSPEQAYELLKQARPALRTSATAAARGAGYLGPVSVEVDRVRFPLKVYGTLAVPPGIYRAVRVTLGEGAGRNWWCVVYPDLCVTDPAAAEALRDHEQIRFYSSIMGKLDEWFGGDGR